MRRHTSNDIKNTKCFYEFYPRDFEALVLPMWLNSSLNNESGKICIRHLWEGEMGSSQHKSRNQDRAFMTSAQISPSRRTNDVYLYSSENI